MVFSFSRRLRRVLPVALTVAACGGASVPTAPSPQLGTTPAARRIVVLGDSLAVSPSAQQSFPAELQRLVDRERPGWIVTNAGVSGDTSAGGARRVAALLQSDVGVLVVALGANDGLAGTPIADVERNLAAIIDAARARDLRVLLCGMETLPAHGWAYVVAFHNLFPRLAQQHNVPLVPFLLSGVALIPEMNEPDGVHPNAAGARRIAQNVWRYLNPMLAQVPSAVREATGFVSITADHS
jgi:acyl-CoA thioesterase I